MLKKPRYCSLKCGSGGGYDCEVCCPGCTKISKSGATWCECGKGPKPKPPAPAPAPAPGPATQCTAAMQKDCGAAQKQGPTTCDNCLKAHWSALSGAGCDASTAGSFCKGGKGPSPAPAPATKCSRVMEEECGAAKKQGNTACDNCLKAHWSSFSAAGCDVKSAEGYCGGKPSKPSQKGGTQYKPYETTYFRPGQTSTSCPTGLMFNSSWDEGVGSGP